MAKGVAIGALLGAMLLASCGGEREPRISLSDGWARETAPGQSMAAAYLRIANQGDGADRLVAARSTAATSVSLHSSSNHDGVAHMRAVTDGVEIERNSTLALEPGGLHIMLAGLKQRLVAGEKISVTVQFERSGPLIIPIHVEPATFVAGPRP